MSIKQGCCVKVSDKAYMVLPEVVSVDKSVVFHFLFGKVLADDQQAGQNDNEKTGHGQGDFEKQIGIDEGKPKLQNQEQHPADEQSETGIDAEFKHVLFPK